MAGGTAALRQKSAVGEGLISDRSESVGEEDGGEGGAALEGSFLSSTAAVNGSHSGKDNNLRGSGVDESPSLFTPVEQQPRYQSPLSASRRRLLSADRAGGVCEHLFVWLGSSLLSGLGGNRAFVNVVLLDCFSKECSFHATQPSLYRGLKEGVNRK